MTTSSRLSTSLPQTIEAIEATRLSAITRLYCLSCSSRALAVIPSFYVASGRRPVVMLSILSLAGCFMRANGGCQTPCLVISACAVAETGTSLDARNPEPRNLVWRPNLSKRASAALLKFIFTTSIWSRDPRTWNLEPPEPGTRNLECGTWNLKPGTYRQKSRKKSRLRRNRNLEPRNLEPLAAHVEPSEPEPRNRVMSRVWPLRSVDCAVEVA